VIQLFTSISIDNFRCFKAFSIESLDRVNVIAGTNNVGKTALLEAIYLLIGATNISLVVKISAFRGVQMLKGDPASVRELLWRPLFPNFDSTDTIQVRGALRTGGQQGIKLRLVQGASARLAVGDAPDIGVETNELSGQTMECRYTDPSGDVYSAQMHFDEKGFSVEPASFHLPFPGFFLASRHRTSPQEDAERFGKLDMVEEPYNLLEALKIVEPRLKRLTTIYGAGVPMIYGDIGLGRMLPLALMGDGLARLTSLLLAIANAPSGVVLVDEIENGLHHSILSKVWQAIGDAARRFDTQVFATTHSFECIRAAHQAFEDSERYDVRLHRLERVADTIRAITYERETLDAAMKADLEVR
jgi:hypothetical protein